MRGAIEQCGTDRDRSGCRGPGKGLACLGRPPFPDGQVRLSRFTAPPTLAGLDRLSDRLRGFPGLSAARPPVDLVGAVGISRRVVRIRQFPADRGRGADPLARPSGRGSGATLISVKAAWQKHKQACPAT